MYKIEDFYNGIIETNNLVGNKINDKTLIKPYENFTKSEFFEIFKNGIEKNNNKEVLDGIIDSLVTGYYLVCLKRHNTNFTTKQTKQFSSKEIAFKLNELKNMINNGLLFDNIEYFVQEMYNIGLSTKFDILGAAKEINRSNMTKFPFINDVNPDKEVQMLNDDGRYQKCYYKKVLDNNKNQRYVFFCGAGKYKGKYLKPSVFEEPNILPFIPDGYDIISEIKPYLS